MDQSCIFWTPRTEGRINFKVRGSRFIGSVAPAASEEDARRLISSISAEFRGATHHAYAYRLGWGDRIVERSSDDGEPAGTAGPPMLQVLRGKKLSDTLVVGTRYFGGTRLGIGGLTRAYRECARIVVDQVKLVEKEAMARCRLSLKYGSLGPVNRLIETMRGMIVSAEYAREVAMEVMVPVQNIEPMFRGFESAVCGRGSITRLNG